LKKEYLQLKHAGAYNQQRLISSTKESGMRNMHVTYACTHLIPSHHCPSKSYYSVHWCMTALSPGYCYIH